MNGSTVCGLLGLVTLLGGCSSAVAPQSKPAPAIWVPEDFPPLPAPDDNTPTTERVALGRHLFYDKRLSRTEEVSCASCHVQENAFADPNPLSTGVEGRIGTRNAPALVNLAWGTSFFWHGGVQTLEVQAVGPIKNPVEMDMSLLEVGERLSADPALAKAFDRAYGEPPSEYSIPRALATFVRSLVSANSPYDRYLRGDASALSAEALRGEALFNGEAGECFHCHAGFNFTNNAFRNNGIDEKDTDPGRSEITLKVADFGKFKVPTLRNVAVSPPYMHDGSLATLEDVLVHYDQGGRGHPNTDPTVQPLGLSDDDKAALIAFLHALTDEDFLREPAFGDPALHLLQELGTKQ